MNIFKLIGISALLLLASCATVQVKPLDTNNHKVRQISIILNKKVKVKDFTDVLIERLKLHNIHAVVLDEKNIPAKGYSITYTARRSHDFVLFLASAELHLHHNGSEVANASYKVPNFMNFDTSKFNSTETKMNPVIDKLMNFTK